MTPTLSPDPIPTLRPESCVPFAHQVIWRNRQRFWRLAILPLAGLILLGLVFADDGPLPQIALPGPVSLPLTALLLVPLFVAWTRSLYRGDTEGVVRPPRAVSLGWREVRTLAWTFALLLITGVAAMIIARIGQSFADVHPGLISLTALALGLPAAYVLTRLLLILPWVALDRPLEPGTVRHLGQGHGFALMVSLLLGGLMFLAAGVVVVVMCGFCFSILGAIGEPKPNLDLAIVGMAMAKTVVLVYATGFLAGLLAHALAWTEGRDLGRTLLGPPPRSPGLAE